MIRLQGNSFRGMRGPGPGRRPQQRAYRGEGMESAPLPTPVKIDRLHSLLMSVGSPGDLTKYIVDGLRGQAPQLPYDLVGVMYFVAYLLGRGLAPATVTGQMSAISFLHKFNDIPDPVGSGVIQKILQGIRKMGGGGDLRLPVTAAILVRLCLKLDGGLFDLYQVHDESVSYGSVLWGFQARGARPEGRVRCSDGGWCRVYGCGDARDFASLEGICSTPGDSCSEGAGCKGVPCAFDEGVSA